MQAGSVATGLPPLPPREEHGARRATEPEGAEQDAAQPTSLVRNRLRRQTDLDQAERAPE